MKRVLFVCMGNICRSPAAEAIFRAKVTEAGREEDFLIDSAGTLGYHAGDPADARMRRHAAQRGYELTSRARQVKARDFQDFDLILAMDQDNRFELLQMAPDEASRDKVRMMLEYGSGLSETEVPDPYYGGDAGFEHVLDLLENACAGLLKALA